MTEEQEINFLAANILYFDENTEYPFMVLTCGISEKKLTYLLKGRLCHKVFFMEKWDNEKLRGYRFKNLLINCKERELSREALNESIIPILSICYNPNIIRDLECEFDSRISDSIKDSPRVFFLK